MDDPVHFKEGVLDEADILFRRGTNRIIVEAC